MVACSLTAFFTSYFQEEKEIQYQEPNYAVQSGDNLFKIASQIAEEGQDIRDVVSEIQDVNKRQGINLDSSLIYPGQKIWIPTK